jgi:hypothetical protein
MVDPVIEITTARRTPVYWLRVIAFCEYATLPKTNENSPI